MLGDTTMQSHLYIMQMSIHHMEPIMPLLVIITDSRDFMAMHPTISTTDMKPRTTWLHIMPKLTTGEATGEVYITLFLHTMIPMLHHTLLTTTTHTCLSIAQSIIMSNISMSHTDTMN